MQFRDSTKGIFHARGAACARMLSRTAQGSFIVQGAQKRECVLRAAVSPDAHRIPDWLKTRLQQIGVRPWASSVTCQTPLAGLTKLSCSGSERAGPVGTGSCSESALLEDEVFCESESVARSVGTGLSRDGSGRESRPSPQADDMVASRSFCKWGTTARSLVHC